MQNMIFHKAPSTLQCTLFSATKVYNRSSPSVDRAGAVGSRTWWPDNGYVE